ncbi:MAG: hypothetical protein ACFB22_01305 [Rhodothalassiaceae bacterium]
MSLDFDIGTLAAWAATTILLLWLADEFGLIILWEGWVAHGLINTLIAWYLVDIFFPRRSMYAWFGLMEEPIKPEIRLWRKALLLALVLGAAAACTATLLGTDSKARAALQSSDAVRTTALLTGAYLAAFGWMFTTYENEKSRRESFTLQAIQYQLYDDGLDSIRVQLTAMVLHIREKHKILLEDPIPINFMKLQLRSLHKDLYATGRYGETLSEILDRYLDHLNQIAFGVRDGQFDIRTIEMVLRRRFLRIAFVFSEYIAKTTRAVDDRQAGRKRATTRTWEHFLWLVYHFPILPSDGISRPEVIVLPLLHSIGGHPSS